MHINAVKVEEMWVSFDIKSINDEIQIVATFTKDEEIIHRIYKIGNVNMIAKLLNREYAIETAQNLIKITNTSKHSPFKKGLIYWMV